MTINQKVKIAIPSLHPGGMESERSEHFGRCDCFTILEVEAGKVNSIEVLRNRPHSEGGCGQAVELLSQNGVNAIIVMGIGRNPYLKFIQAGIDVYASVDAGLVGSVIEEYLLGKIKSASDENLCGHRSHDHSHEHVHSH